LELIDDNVHLVQRISSELRPGLLDNLGLSAAIEWQAAQLRERTGIEYDFASEPEDIVLDQARSTALFRIFQETCTNIARHAKATKMAIMLKETPEEVVLRISDDGRGIKEEEISNPRSFGLMGIKERVLSLGGAVEFLGGVNQGTTVRVRLPKSDVSEVAGDQNSGSR